MAVVSSVALFSTDKIDIHLAINALNAPAADFFFKYWTYVGDGIFVALAAVLIAIFSFKKHGWTPFLFGAAALMFSGVSVQFLKRFVFDGALRPSAFITEHTLHLVDGVKMHAHHSFPSGHTTVAFAFFGFAAVILARKNAGLQVLFAVCAGLVGYSRMYLSQHFLEDVFAGLLLGTFWVMALTILFRKRLN
ncbi:MAG: hypothetical protein Crog4KO_11100 [Crocinitomicaceae bacterium]